MRSETSAAETSGPVVRLENVVKTFLDFWHRPMVRALKEVSFQLESGEIFGLLGPNGSGKSTTLKIILGLLNPTSGKISVFGRAPSEVRIKARIGYLPEETRLYPFLTASETLYFYGKLFDLTRNECRSRVKQLLEMTGLAHVRDRRVGEFSKGMARRLGLAQALINDPDLLILDEPTSGLDPIGCRQVKDLISSLGRRGKTILLSSHLLADVQDICGRLAILRHGRPAVNGKTRDLLEDRKTVSMALEGISDEAAREAATLVHERFGVTPRLEHPARSLERFFLEIVEQAPAVDTPDISGAMPSAGIAPYLTRAEATPHPDAALAALVPGAPQPPASSEAPQKPPLENRADERLDHLLSRPGTDNE